MKVYIHPAETGGTRAELIRMLEHAGFTIVDDLNCADLEVDGGERSEAAEPAGDEAASKDEAPACVVVLAPGLTESDFEPELTRAVSRGCRIIGVWGPGHAAADVSPLKDYGDDTVPWDGARLRDAIYGTPQHAAPDGSPMPKPDTTHGGC